MLRICSHVRSRRLRARGFTLAELLIAVAMLAILATLALPSYRDFILRARRADAHAALARLQLAQERLRSQQPRYADSIAAGGFGPARSADGHYELAASTPADRAAMAYRVSASATGAQAADAGCRHLAIEVDGGLVVERSGPTDTLANDADTNRRCWNR